MLVFTSVEASEKQFSHHGPLRLSIKASRMIQQVYLSVVWPENAELESNQGFWYTITLVLIKLVLNV